MRAQRSARNRGSATTRRSSPSRRICPAATGSAGGRSPMIAWAITDFPDPDSPTRQTISPAATLRLALLTAFARSAPTGSMTVRSRMSRTGAMSSRENGWKSALSSEPLAHAWVQRVAQSVAQQVDRKDSQRQKYARIENAVGIDPEERPAFCHDVAPGRGLRGYAHTQEGEKRFDQDRGGADVGCLHDQRRQCVGQNVASHK